MTLTGIAAAAAVTAPGIRELLTDAKVLGGVYHLDYSRAVVLTNDVWKRDTGGVPQSTFLIATTIRPDTPGEPDDEELILLRVEGVAPLPNQTEMVATRMDAMRGAMEQDRPAIEVVDPLTRGEMQWSALECRVLGTFYDDVVNGQRYVAYGADIDNLYSSARYFVYKPSPAALSWVTSYPEVTPADLEVGRVPERIRIGTVRYASTRRRAASAGHSDVPVLVRVEDFIAMKTAVFGMTRAGKSNTMKTVATAVFEHSQSTGSPIGQLLFDPAGEYAAVNVQDQTALRLIGDEWVRIFRFGADGTDPAIRPLQVNFFDDSQRPIAAQVISLMLQGEGAGYVDKFRSVDLEDPDRGDFQAGPDGDSEFRRALCHRGRTRFAFYALLAKAGYQVPGGWAGARFQMKGALADQLLADRPTALRHASGYALVTSRQGLIDAMDWLVANSDQPDVKDFCKDEQFQAVKAVYDRTGGTVAFARLVAGRHFHNANARRDYCEDILDELIAGRIVIVDLSLGDEAAIQILSERVVLFLLERAAERFKLGLPAHRLQVYVEEAHRLFDREKFTAKTVDPWVRLAKEAAKYEIGLVYATQEVSSVDQRVLANTHNWVVAHLNSKREIRELSNYYDFESFADATMKAEDRGYVRLKALSGKYIVPVQIDRFSHDKINSARVSAGLPEIPAGVGNAGPPGAEPLVNAEDETEAG